VRQYNWHALVPWVYHFQSEKYKYIFLKKYAETILSKSTRKVVWFDITKMLIAVFEK